MAALKEAANDFTLTTGQYLIDKHFNKTGSLFEKGETLRK